MNEITDTINLLNLEAWNAIETGVFSYLKTPIQQTSFTNNSDIIGKALRQTIIYFAETLNTADRPSCTLGNEYRSSRTHKYQVLCSVDEKASDTTTAPIEITTFAPIAFEYVRTSIGITRNDFQSSFNNAELINFANTGRSGSQMYKTQDDVYVIKTLRDHEAKLLLQVLPGLHLRYSYTSSLLTRYVGLYSVHIRSLFSSEIYCVVMLNHLPSILDLDEVYDLKGSTIGRFSSINLPSKRLKALKDLDFVHELFYPYGIRIPHEIYRRLKVTLESDILELKKMMITDFSLILGIHQLDQPLKDKENNEDSTKLKPNPKLGISSLFAVRNVDRTAIGSNNADETNEKIKVSTTTLIKKFTMKPLHLISCPQEDSFNDSTMATSLLGIPGVTHKGHRVLLYPALIDCLQSFDNFKRMQHAIQNFRDPKQGSEYSVIHPDEYVKRFTRFLFDKVFIDTKQSLDEILATPFVPDSLLQNDIEEEYEDQNGHSNQPRESFEIIRIPNTENAEMNNQTVIETVEIIQNLTIQPLTTTDEGKLFIETKSL